MYSATRYFNLPRARRGTGLLRQPLSPCSLRYLHHRRMHSISSLAAYLRVMMKTARRPSLWTHTQTLTRALLSLGASQTFGIFKYSGSRFEHNHEEVSGARMPFMVRLPSCFVYSIINSSCTCVTLLLCWFWFLPPAAARLRSAGPCSSNRHRCLLL